MCVPGMQRERLTVGGMMMMTSRLLICAANVEVVKQCRLVVVIRSTMKIMCYSLESWPIGVAKV